jgi:prepilin-type N-terminal cleavage/methylation domain-containing protein
MARPVPGFTILELIVVVIIIGILSTLGAQKYASTVEKSRGAEAKQVCGHIRTLAQAHYLQHQSLSSPSFQNDEANIGLAGDQHPQVCRPSHYFRYDVDVLADTRVRITATRCRNNGKPPDVATGCGAAAPRYILTADLDSGENSIQSDGY